MKRVFESRSLSAAALLVLSAMSGWAQAQDATPTESTPAPTGTAPADSTPTQPKGRELPTVIVTAQKVAQTLEQVPAAVTTLDGEFIENTGITRFTDLQNYSSNVNITVSTSSAQIGVRGFTTPDQNRGFDPSVGTVIDGIYYGRNSFLTAFFQDMDRFEVLKGPQGTLFGKNSTAGVLNVTTRAPEKDYAWGATYIRDDNDTFSFRPMVNIPLTENLDVRLSGSYSADSGTAYNTFLNRPENNAHINSTRARVRYRMSDDWVLDFAGFLSNQYLNYNIYTVTKVGDAMRALATSYDPNFDSDINHRKVSANVPSQERGVIRGASFTADHDFGKILGLNDFHFITISSWGEQLVRQRDLDGDFTAVPFIRDTLINPSPYQQISEEFRFTGGADDFFGFGKGITFIGGFFFYQSTFKSSDYFFIQDLGAAAQYELAVQADGNGLPGGLLINTVNPLAPVITIAGQQLLGEQSARVSLDQLSRTYAGFGQFEHAFTDQWGLIGGVRVALETKDGDAHSHATGQLVPLIAHQQDHDTVVSRQEVDVSPKIGVKWTSMDKTLNSYATWSRGYKSGGFNALPLAPDNLEYGPEEASSYEIGAKWKTLNGSMFLGGAVFNTTFSNLQLSSFQNNSFVVLNAGKARSVGADLDLRWLPPIEGTQVFASLGYADARFISYPNAPARAGTTGPQDLSGERLPFSSNITASVVPSYSLFMDVLGGIVGSVSTDFIYRSWSYVDIDNDPNKVQPGTFLLNARVSLASGDKRWNLTLGGYNLTDRLIVDQIIGQPLAPGNLVTVRTDRGRYFNANLALNF